LIPRAISDVSSIDLSLDVFGRIMPSPILVVPTVGHQQLHRDGEKETHRGTTAAGSTMVVSANASYPPDPVVAAASP